jgi:hypothetical protein
VRNFINPASLRGVLALFLGIVIEIGAATTSD